MATATETTPAARATATAAAGPQASARRRAAARPDIPETHLRDMQDKLQQKLGTAVHVYPSRTLSTGRRAKGRIEIDYFTGDDLDRLMLVLGISDAF